MSILFVCILFCLILCAFWIGFLSNDTIKTFVFTSLFSLLLTCFYSVANAPDVALTECVVGLLVSGLFFVITAKVIDYNSDSEGVKFKKLDFFCFFGLFVLICIPVIYALGSFGVAGNNMVYNYYITKTPSEIGIANVVTAILAAYRGFDTMGETTIIVLAALGVYFILEDEKDA